MNVADFRRYLLHMNEFVNLAGGGKAIKGIDLVIESLAPFDAMEFSAFAQFLKKAEEYQRTGVLAPQAPKARATPVPKSPKVDVESVAQQIRTLYDSAINPDMTTERIHTECQILDSLTVTGLTTVAVKLGLPPTIKNKSKKAIIDLIRNTIVTRRTTYHRAAL